MPRKAQINFEIVKKTLELFPLIFDVNGILKTASNHIWIDICTHASLTRPSDAKVIFKPKQLHDYVYQDRHGLKSHLLQTFGFSLSERIADSENSDENSPELINSSNSSLINDPDFGIRQEKTWMIEVPYADYEKIEPTSILYKEGKVKKIRKVLKKNTWTAVIGHHIYEQHRIPCSFSFKRNKVRIDSSGAGRFIVANGQCTYCKAAITVSADHEPDFPNPLIFNIQVPDTRNIPHQGKKTQVRGTWREEIGNELLNVTPANWRRAKARTGMKFGETEPPSLPSVQVCRKIRQEAKLKDLNLNYIKDPVWGLMAMKHSTPYVASIHTICLDKFFAHYWTNEQIHIYKQYCSKTKIPAIQIDATGSVVKKIIREGEKSSHIYFYSLIIHFEGKIMSISQMLSESQDTPTISYWLQKWLKDVGKFPKECVSDFSMALLGASSRSLNECSLQKYLATCFSIISLEKNIERPVCYLRVDVAHTIKIVCRWNCYPAKARLVRKFYIRCIALMLKCTLIDDLRSLFMAIIILAKSETCSNAEYGGYPTKCEEAKVFLGHCIEKGITDSDIPASIDVYQSTSSDDEENEMDEIAKEATSITGWIEEIVSEASTACNIIGCDPNPYFCPDIVPNNSRLMKYFPLWTGVMKNVIDSPRSTASSAAFE